MRGYYRHTKIIATIGPSTETRERLTQLIASGADVLRLNMAHGTGDWVRSTVKNIREVSAEVQRQVAIMMDVKGPEVRTGVVGEPIELKLNDTFEFYTVAPTEGVRGVSVNYPGLPADVSVGSTVLVDSGLLRMEVLEKDATHVRCRVLTPGKLGSRRHINLPGVQINLPALTAKDEADIKVAAEVGIDFIALSFVRRSEDVVALRQVLDELESRRGSSPRSKISRGCETWRRS